MKRGRAAPSLAAISAASNHFDGNGETRVRVECLKHDSHSTEAQLANNIVVSNSTCASSRPEDHRVRRAIGARTSSWTLLLLPQEPHYLDL